MRLLRRLTSLVLSMAMCASWLPVAGAQDNVTRPPGRPVPLTTKGGAGGKAEGNPVGKVIFLKHDRRFREGDPECRADFERMG